MRGLTFSQPKVGRLLFFFAGAAGAAGAAAEGALLPLLAVVVLVEEVLALQLREWTRTQAA